MAAAIPLAIQGLTTLLVSSAGLAPLAASLVTGGAGLVGAYVASELSGGRDKINQERDQLASRENSTTTEKTIPIVYGVRPVGGNDVFVATGTKGEPPKDGSVYLWIVQVLAEGVCEGIEQINISITPTPDYRDEIYIDGKLIWDYTEGRIKYWFYDGTSNQQPNTVIGEGTKKKDGTIEYTDALQNTCYIIFRLNATKLKLTSVPTREVVLKGAKCYNIKTGVSESTTNPALHLLDYITNSRYGLGWDINKIDETTWIETLEYCENYGWENNYIIASQLSSRTIRDSLLGHFRGALSLYNDTLYLRFIDLRVNTVCFAIKDEHIARDEDKVPLVSVSQPSRHSLPEGAVVNYLNKKDNWAVDRIIIGETEGQIIRLDFIGMTDRGKALEMGTYVLERLRLNRTYTFTLRADTVFLDPGDLVTITSSELGLSSQKARVQGSSFTQEGLVHVVAILEDLELYNKEFNPDNSPIYDVDFPSITEPPPSVEDVYAVEDIYDFRDRSGIRLNVFFSWPTGYPWFSHANVYIAFPDEFGSPPTADAYLFHTSAPNSFFIDPVEEGEVYYIRLNSVSTYGAEQENAHAFILRHEVLGVSNEFPPCPTYLAAAVNMGSVDLRSPEIDTKDVAGYEFRLGATWQTAIFLTFRSHPSVSFNSVRPGEHKFWVNSKHKNGKYCATPVSDIALIEDPPPGSHSFFEEIIDYAHAESVSINMTVTGTYPNQEIYCTHSGGVYEGEFLSNQLETGNLDPSQKMLVYAMFGTYLNDLGDSWNDLAPLSVSWWTFAYDPTISEWKTWNDISGNFSRTPAPKVETSVYYSEFDGGPYQKVERLELLTAVVTGMYFKIEHKIKDIKPSSYITITATTAKAAYIEDSLLINA